jgi:hypothetical protein
MNARFFIESMEYEYNASFDAREDFAEAEEFCASGYVDPEVECKDIVF